MSVVRNANTSAFLDYWSAAGAITLRVFDHAAEVKGTPLEEHPLFADPVKLKRVMFTPATYTDVLRLIILHNYGGAPAAAAARGAGTAPCARVCVRGSACAGVAGCAGRRMARGRPLASPSPS